VEERVKQRLVGAIVLVALAVIFVPMILQGPGEGNGSGADLPPPPKVVQESLPTVPAPQQVPPTPRDGVALGSPQGEAAPAAGGTAGASGSAQNSAPTPPPAPATVPQKQEAPAPSEDKAVPPAADTDSQLTAWVVQVGSFTRLDNARALSDKLKAKGFTAFVQQAVTADGKVYRVEVGPVLTRPEGDALQGRLQTQMQLKGIVTPHR